MAKDQAAEGVRRALTALRRDGLLLKQDKALPSVVGLVTGESLSASWWAHPRAHEIYAVLAALSESSDVLEAKLCSGKVTFVWRALWPALLGVATSGEAWQLGGLTAAAARLLSDVSGSGEREATGVLAKELEQRLLVRSVQQHTESGRHVLVLETWQRWSEREGVTPLGSSDGKERLESAVAALGAPLETLPWRRKRSRQRRASS